jgi:hypothetical protein
MTRINPLTSSVLIERLSSEISRLSQQQSEALGMAALVGMTEDEAREFEQRRRTIGELVGELAMLRSPRTSL